MHQQSHLQPAHIVRIARYCRRRSVTPLFSGCVPASCCSHVCNQNPLGPDHDRLLDRAHYPLAGHAMDGLAPWLSASARAALVRAGATACPSTFLRHSLLGGTPTTPTRPPSLSREPVLPRRAGSSPSPPLSACRCGVRARQGTSPPTGQRVGRQPARRAAPVFWVQTASCLDGSIRSTCATMAPSTSCVLHRRAAARASGS